MPRLISTFYRRVTGNRYQAVRPLIILNRRPRRYRNARLVQYGDGWTEGYIDMGWCEYEIAGDKVEVCSGRRSGRPVVAITGGIAAVNVAPVEIGSNK